MILKIPTVSKNSQEQNFSPVTIEMRLNQNISFDVVLHSIHRCVPALTFTYSIQASPVMYMTWVDFSLTVRGRNISLGVRICNSFGSKRFIIWKKKKIKRTK